MNQELLNNPYDEELQSVTRPFGELLRAIVTTIDKHGLKRVYLKKHSRAVAKYLEFLSEQNFQSDAAEAIRNRLIKYRDRLFTFIEHDGIPWNNNNAENAIKQFAYYREDTVGLLKVSGLRNYLVLLSIYQTCRYKNISFFRFLLSGERDMDLFCQRKSARRTPSSVEVFPKGFITSHFANLHKQESQEAGNDGADRNSQQQRNDGPTSHGDA